MLLAAKASKATEKVFIASHSRILTFDIRSGEAVVNTDGQVSNTSCKCAVQLWQVGPVTRKATSNCNMHMASCRDSTMASSLVTVILPTVDPKRSGHCPGRGSEI